VYFPGPTEYTLKHSARLILVGLKPNKPVETRRVEVDLKRAGYLAFFSVGASLATQQKIHASAASTSFIGCTLIQVQAEALILGCPSVLDFLAYL
jgi:hypothetical protein